mgnify:CR=1 FL=1
MKLKQTKRYRRSHSTRKEIKDILNDKNTKKDKKTLWYCKKSMRCLWKMMKSL